MSGHFSRPASLVGGAVLIGVPVLLAAALGYRAGTGNWPSWREIRSVLEGHGPAGTASAPQPQKTRKVLYYRNPMGRPDVSPVPKKDEMGMDYIPVYEGEEPEEPGTVKVSLERIQRAGVTTEAAALRPLSRPVRAPGVARIDERTLHVVSLRADAFIEKLYVEETGAHIKAGAPLFRIYSPAMVSAQVDYRTAQRGRGEGADGAQHLAGAEQKLRNLEIPEAVTSRLRRTGELTLSIDWPSPASGVILVKNAAEGQMVRMGEEIFRIASLDRIWVEADVAEQDIGLVAPGQPATVRFKAFPAETFPGSVTFVLHELQKATRTARVRLEMANPGHRIKHEMFADVVIDAAAGEAPRLAIPRSAVLDTGERQVVLAARGSGRFAPREVTLGREDGGYVEVREGLAPGEEVVVRANFLIGAESNLKAALASFSAGTGKGAGGTPGN